MRDVRRVLTCAVAAALLVGCGNERTRPGDLSRIGPPGAFEDTRFRSAGVFLRTPQKWRVSRTTLPEVVNLVSGSGLIAVWRYERTEPLPENREQLEAARDVLLQQIERRDPSFDVERTRVVIKPGVRGVEVIGTGTNQGQRRKVRSLHAYGHRGEVVVDGYAPPEQFERVDEDVFGPVARSLKLSEPGSGR